MWRRMDLAKHRKAKQIHEEASKLKHLADQHKNTEARHPPTLTLTRALALMRVQGEQWNVAELYMQSGLKFMEHAAAIVDACLDSSEKRREGYDFHCCVIIDTEKESRTCADCAFRCRLYHETALYLEGCARYCNENKFEKFAALRYAFFFCFVFGWM